MTAEPSDFNIGSKYLQRVDWALGSGVYAEAFAGSQRFIQSGFSVRQRSDPYYFDGSGLLAPLVIQAALFQDAIMAEERLNFKEESRTQ